jgi:hypothetical protein
MAEIKLTGRIVKAVQDPLPAGNVEETYVVIEKDKGDGRVFLIPINQAEPVTVKVMNAQDLLEEILLGRVRQAGGVLFSDIGFLGSDE